MQLSIHYYVLSVSDQTSKLYEGFRDKLIDIHDVNFPFAESDDNGRPDKSAAKELWLNKFFLKTDQRFGHYHHQDPLRLVLVGKKSNLSIFAALTTHGKIMIGVVEGDYTATSAHDLGKIVWPVVKESIAGAKKNAMHDLAEAAKTNKVVYGIDAVGQSAESEEGSTLFVEEDYHLRGSILKTDKAMVISKHVNLWEVIDDVVDVIIEKVLRMGGNVVFLNSGSLIKLDKIAMILRG